MLYFAKEGKFVNFRKFLTEVQSIRDYEGKSISEKSLNEIKTFLESINTSIAGKESFSFRVYEKGIDVFDKLEGVGGYSGIMIKSPHYIGLLINDNRAKTEFLGAYYMQSIVKKLYDMDLGSCWIDIKDVSKEIKAELSNGNEDVNYLLAFGNINKKALKEKSRTLKVQSGGSYKTNPYGAKATVTDTDTSRLSLSEIAFLYEWGKEISYDDLQMRGLEDLFLYIRNAPSYKNKQPSRFIIKDGEAQLAVINPHNRQNIIDAGIMMYTFEGMTKELGIPSSWHCTYGDKETFSEKEYAILAEISL